MRRLENRRAVVTGGAMGIGLATARRLLREGCSVTIWDINPSALHNALNDLQEYRGRIFGYVCDVTNKERVYELARVAQREMGGVDILINNAGFVEGGTLLDHSDDVWERTIAVNLTSYLYTIRAFLPSMYERNEGHIVNISSAAGTLGVGGLAVYAATKWAVWGLTESLRFEAWNAGKKGVRYSTIHPSYLAKGMFQGARLAFPGVLIAPLVKNHDVIAKAIVERALKRGAYSPKRPWTVNLTVRLRGVLPDKFFQRFIVWLGISDSMKSWKGHEQ